MAQGPEAAIAETERALNKMMPDWRERSRRDITVGRARIAVLRIRMLLWILMKSDNPLVIFTPTPRTPDLAAKGVVQLAVKTLHPDSPEAAQAIDALFDSVRPDWREAFAQDLPWGIDLRITVGRLLGQAVLMTDGPTASPLDHIWQVDDVGPTPDTPGGAARVTAIMFARLLSGTKMAA